ncbi:hypothetical protein BKA63DRAFT_549007 [Paraphoma chrysanthemicola]|nr:hypothetical protein BKA63DRAFT_549007 [Paraphoma chrysanthemicola]
MPLSKFSSLLSTLSVNTSSAHPTPQDSADVDTTLFGEKTPTSTSDQQMPLFVPQVTNVVVQHSSAFNSERATGMNKVKQMQFVEMLKKDLMGSYSGLSRRGSGYQVFKVATARARKSSPAALNSFCKTITHTAVLLGMEVNERGWTVLEKSDECEYLSDAVEDLWGRVMGTMSGLVGGCKIGERPLSNGDEKVGGVGMAKPSESLLSR